MIATTFEGYVGLALIIAVCGIIGFAALMISKLLGPRRRTRVKELPYECGVEPLQPSARERYSIHFYLIAILFILFDLETVFLFPWASHFEDGTALGPVRVVLFIEVLAFVLILGAGLFYVWKRRGLEWD